MPYKILIADDEEEILEALGLFFENDGYIVMKAENGAKALNIINEGEIDLAIIDIMMPELDGLKLIKKIRETSNIPVIIQSARNNDSDKILGLGLGADDYATKPCNPLEILARAKAQLRRYYDFNSDNTTNEKSTIQIGNIELNILESTLKVMDEYVELTSMEYKILKLLMKSAGRILTKKQIFESVWNDSFIGDDSTIMVHISNIRNKIKDDSKHPKYIRTIKGLGYKFERKVISVKNTLIMQQILWLELKKGDLK